MFRKIKVAFPLLYGVATWIALMVFSFTVMIVFSAWMIKSENILSSVEHVYAEIKSYGQYFLVLRLVIGASIIVFWKEVVWFFERSFRLNLIQVLYLKKMWPLMIAIFVLIEVFRALR